MFLSLLLGLLLFACSNYEQLTNSDNNLESDEELSLDKDYGGYNTCDELVAFGDPELLDEFSGDAEVEDKINDKSEIIEELNSSSVKAYFLRITWGLLEGDSSATEIIDWTGSIEVNKGTLVILRTILFGSSRVKQQGPKSISP